MLVQVGLELRIFVVIEIPLNCPGEERCLDKLEHAPILRRCRIQRKPDRIIVLDSAATQQGLEVTVDQNENGERENNRRARTGFTKPSELEMQFPNWDINHISEFIALFPRACVPAVHG
jgi:hypothetical protein